MAIAKKTFHSPYITHVISSEVSSFTPIEGVIDLIKVTGTDAAASGETARSQAEFVLSGPNFTDRPVDILAGDVLEGPFTKVDITAITETAGHTDVFIYERDRTIVS